MCKASQPSLLLAGFLHPFIIAQPPLCHLEADAEAVCDLLQTLAALALAFLKELVDLYPCLYDFGCRLTADSFHF